MSRGVNKATLIGNLGQDPETRSTGSGRAVTTVRLATSRAWKDKESGEPRESTQWHRVVFFDRLAEIAGDFLKKGSRLYVEGEIRYRKVDGESGQQARWFTDIVASDMLLLGGAQGSGKPGAFEDETDDFPF